MLCGIGLIRTEPGFSRLCLSDFQFSAQHLSEAVSILISKDGGNDKEHKKSVAEEITGNNSFYVGTFIARFQLDKAVHAQRQHKENRKPNR